MKPAAALLLLALAAGSTLLTTGCSTPERPRGSATVTLFGPESRLESWKTAVIDGAHVHPADPDLPCESAGLKTCMDSSAAILAARDERFREPAKNLGSTAGALMESMIVQSRGPARGGPDRSVVALMHLGADGSTIDQALLVDLPRLQPGVTERLFKRAEIGAWFERPLLTPEAVLERGWVRAVRLESGAVDYELFLVLKPARPGASYESLQVVARVAGPVPGR